VALDGATNVKTPLGLKVDGMCFLGRVERSEPDALAVDVDLSTESIAVRRHSHHFQLVVSREAPAILNVDVMGDITKVVPSVVRGISVDMVNVAMGPTAGDVQPDEAVNLVVCVADHALHTTVTHDVTDHRPSTSATTTEPARKNAFLRVVVEVFAKVVGGYFNSLWHIAIVRPIGVLS
jgi:hypothetical protein